MKLSGKKVKKEFAVVFRCTTDFGLKISQVILALEKNSPTLVSDYIIYYSKRSLNNLDLIDKIVKKFHKQVHFHEFELPKSEQTLINDKFTTRYSDIVFAIFKIFDLLNEYKHVLALDADLLIQKPIDDIKNFGPLLYRNARPINSTLSSHDAKFYGRFTPNAGVLYINDLFPEYKNLTQRCFELLEKYSSIIKITYEEAILGILFAELDIKSKNSGITYNYWVAESNKECSGGLDAKIIHFVYVDKPWNNFEVRRIFPQYSTNLIDLCHLLNIEIPELEISRSTYYDSVRRDFCNTFNKQLYNQLIKSIPDNFYIKLEVDYPVLRFHSKEFTENVYFDLRYKPQFCKKGKTLEQTILLSKINNFEIGVTLIGRNIMEMVCLSKLNDFCLKNGFNLIKTETKVVLFAIASVENYISEYLNLVSKISNYLKENYLFISKISNEGRISS